MTKIQKARHQGMEEGITRYAWQRNCVEYVGPWQGVPLRAAIRKLDEEFRYQCLAPTFQKDKDGIEFCNRCGVYREYHKGFQEPRGSRRREVHEDGLARRVADE